MRNTAFSIVLLILVLLSHKSYSSHIIGGEIYYECLGYGNNGLDTTKRKYLITIKLYRDCYGSVVPFDTVLGFTIYRQSGNAYLNTKSGTGINSEYRIPFTIPVQKIDPPHYPCLEVPKNVCGETGTYEMAVELPIINENYVIVWQRCCRNFSLSNIKDPGKTGATFTIQIHPEAQRVCNSSPRFKNFPSTVLCVNAPFTFDHSAVDKDGDQLVYSFCESLKGGDSSNNSLACKGGDPSPDCPPPYVPVEYKSPYSAQSPLGGNPPIAIGSMNGIISGKPTINGQFVVSVCVYESRNGVLLSVLKRDFQFNVALCDGYTEAKIEGTEVTSKHFEFNVCGTNEWHVTNKSNDQKSIHNLMWISEYGGLSDTVYGWDPVIKFKEAGIHTGKFILNPYSNCGDTGYFKINVVPDLKPDFKMVYDTCKAGPVQLIDQSTCGYSKIEKWEWSTDWSTKLSSTMQNPVFQFQYPNYYNIDLIVEDNFGCRVFIGKRIEWFPAPAILFFRPNVNEGCVPFDVEFRDISFPSTSNFVFSNFYYKYFWKFSDGTIDSGSIVRHTFKEKGNYDLKLQIIASRGCVNEAEFKNVVTAYDPPTANWAIDTSIINSRNRLIHLKDESIGTIGRTWIIDNTQYFFEPDLQVALNDSGIHHIRMIATDRFLCTDTLDTDIYVDQDKDFKLFMPNAFTPNADGKNDDFGPVGLFNSIEKYELTIYDRWGSKLFSSTDPNQSWNGKFENTGDDLPPGSYVYNVFYKVKNKDPVHEQKMLMLIK